MVTFRTYQSVARDKTRSNKSSDPLNGWKYYADDNYEGIKYIESNLKKLETAMKFSAGMDGRTFVINFFSTEVS